MFAARSCCDLDLQGSDTNFARAYCTHCYLCTYQVSWAYLLEFLSYQRIQILSGQTDWLTDGLTDGRRENHLNKGTTQGLILLSLVKFPLAVQEKKSFAVFLIPYRISYFIILYINVKLWPPGRGQFWPKGHNLNNFGRGPLDDALYQIWKLWAL